jgi:Putative amidoligase enzyme
MSTQSVITGFGVEIELSFAFHEDYLVSILEKRNLTRDHIVKNIPFEVQRDIGLKHHGNPALYAESRPHHRGWVLRIDYNESSVDWQASDEERANGIGRAGTNGDLRTYWTEPLYILQHVLQDTNHTIDVEVSRGLNTEQTPYKKWKVVNDHSLVPLHKYDMQKRLSDRIPEIEIDDWDNTGLELVTPIMHRRQEDFDQIRLYLEALVGTDGSKFGIFPQKYGSIHVHIGFAESDKTLLVLQHLAFIMVQYESLLMKLFPFHRDGSNMRNFEPGYLGICKEDTRSNRDAARFYLVHDSSVSGQSMEDIGKILLGTTSVAELCKVMQYSVSSKSGHGTKGYLVNFINISEAEKGIPGAKPTVEFRHHESTVAPEDITLWVKLLLMICDAAERIARNDETALDPKGKSAVASAFAQREVSKHLPIPPQLDHVRQIDELFELIDLGENDGSDRDLREHWLQRYALYHSQTQGEQASPSRPDRSGSGSPDPKAPHSEEQTTATSSGNVADQPMEQPEDGPAAGTNTQDQEDPMEVDEDSETDSRILRKRTCGPKRQRVVKRECKMVRESLKDDGNLPARTLRSGRRY